MSGSIGAIAQRLFPINLSFLFAKTEIGVLSMDVLLSERISWDGKVTHYPVEDGTEISDHIFEGSRTLSLSGTQSVAEGYSFNFASGKTRLIDAVMTLEQLKKERKLITVTTGLMVYENMAIESLTASRSNNAPRDGNWLDITAELRHVKKVTLRTAEIPPEQATARNGTRGRTGQTAARNGQNSTGGSRAAQPSPAAGNTAARAGLNYFGVTAP